MKKYRNNIKKENPLPSGRGERQLIFLSHIFLYYIYNNALDEKGTVSFDGQEMKWSKTEDKIKAARN